MGETIDSLWTNLRLLRQAGEEVVSDAVIAVKDKRIVYAGPRSEAPDVTPKKSHDVMGVLATPGLVDCHTHLVYGGHRAKEFEMRLEGASYTDIAKAGGGILSTVKATREATEYELFAEAAKRLRRLMAEGVTTIEIKSGYGLDTETEIKMLRVARQLDEAYPVTIRTTFLGAHALPTDYAERADDYIDYVCQEMLPACAEEGLVDAVDGFCESIGFSQKQMRRVFDVAKAHGLPVKLHAEQLTDQQGAELVAEFGGLSADHLEYLTEKGAKAMAKAGTVAVILPAAFYFLRETTKPPIDLLRQHKVPMAVATDSNPGTAPIESLLLTANMACTFFGMTVEEVWHGITAGGAKALGLEDRGTLQPGQRADFALWDTGSPAELVYRIAANTCLGRVVGGVPYFHRS